MKTENYAYILGGTMLMIFGAAGAFVTFTLFSLMSLFSKKQEIWRAKNTAKDIIKTAEDKASFLQEQSQVQVREYEMNLNADSHNKLKELKAENYQIQSSLDKQNYKNQILIQSMQKKVNRTKKKLKYFKLNYNSFKNNSDQKDQLRKECLEKLKQFVNMDYAGLQEEIEEREVQESKARGLRQAQYALDASQKDLEKQTQTFLERVINRFQKPCCLERGIKPVIFKNLQSFNRTIGQNKCHLNLLEKTCGVDVIVDKEALSLVVQGLDPVRREWGRFSLSKLEKKKRINHSIVSSVIRQAKRDLFQKISRDGKKVCDDLKLYSTSSEVQNMMGALRYRYSFAQNQHFHCEEVGYLCGLLQAEFGEEVQKGRTAGLFHDIGKAMDHAKSGGHAVIGADFIQKHGADEDVVYAVRAHHNDVPPQNNLDFFVIAADAISGARPGARRSTVDSYDQKLLSLEKICKSFNGVQDIHIMNAGREVRVIVNNKLINDSKALELSKQIAQRIEEECSYPGWIKVTVVRKLEVSQVSQAAH